MDGDSERSESEIEVVVNRDNNSSNNTTTESGS